MYTENEFSWDKKSMLYSYFMKILLIYLYVVVAIDIVFLLIVIQRQFFCKQGLIRKETNPSNLIHYDIPQIYIKVFWVAIRIIWVEAGMVFGIGGEIESGEEAGMEPGR